MEDKIEVGEFVRTSKGIIGILKEQFTFGNGVNYPEPQEWVLDVNGNEYIANEANYENIVKHSSNILDLIEVGDYVNGKYVYSIGTAVVNFPIINHTDGTFTPSNMIKTIVTKEQFESVKYKI